MPHEPRSPLTSMAMPHLAQRKLIGGHAGTRHEDRSRLGNVVVPTLRDSSNRESGYHAGQDLETQSGLRGWDQE